jgi:NhaA family Na+:H+ antiporter
VATDIAFAVGVPAVLGSRVSAEVKGFVVGMAIVDDIIAIVVLAVFSSESKRAELARSGRSRADGRDDPAPGRGGGCVAVCTGRRSVWYATDASGVHATITGIALGLLTPGPPVP